MKIDGERASDRTTELILACYAAYNRGEVRTVLELLCDDIVHDINEGRRERGREAFAVYLERRHRCYRERLSQVVVMTSHDGTRAAAEYVVEGEYVDTDGDMPAAHGQRYRLAGGAFFEVRDGRIARISNYFNQSDWLRQVG
ncbi:MAG TPA: ketosteroid isomerase-related protein [Xanthomonadaceae bacterium]|nr:ketosteroid isomerase-related protein [Xanthomonadaceae bacterium]